MQKINSEDYFSVDRLRWYMKVPLRKKLEFLEQRRDFLNGLLPAKTKKLAQQLKQRGF